MPGQPGALFSARKRAEFLFRSGHVGGVRFFLGVVCADISFLSAYTYLRAELCAILIHAFTNARTILFFLPVCIIAERRRRAQIYYSVVSPNAIYMVNFC